MFFGVFLLCFVICVYRVESIITKSVILTPSNTNADGAAITISSSNNDCSSDITNNEWDIYVNNYANSQTGYHLEMDLSSEWGFHPNLPSTITLTLYSDEPLHDPINNDDLDVLVSFSVDNNEYVTVWIAADNGINNHIYPDCDSNTLASGDVKSFVDQSTYNGWSNRDQKTTNGGGANIGTLNPLNLDSYPVEWPMVITLENDPNTDSLKVIIGSDAKNWDTFTQSCSYNAFTTNKGLQIYLALDDNTESISFQQFRIQYQYDPPPTTSTPTTSTPTTSAPTTSTPTTTDSPTTYSPTTASPITDSPTTSSPTTSSPTATSPTTASPTTDSPTTISPTISISSTLIESSTSSSTATSFATTDIASTSSTMKSDTATSTTTSVGSTDIASTLTEYIMTMESSMITDDSSSSEVVNVTSFKPTNINKNTEKNESMKLYSGNLTDTIKLCIALLLLCCIIIMLLWIIKICKAQRKYGMKSTDNMDTNKHSPRLITSETNFNSIPNNTDCNDVP